MLGLLKKSRQKLAIFAIFLLLACVIPFSSANADPGSPIYLTPILTTTFDGVAPLPSALDNSTTNHIVANLDSVGQDFDFTVNTNDGQSHNLSYVILTATLAPDAGSVAWSEGSLPSVCIGQFSGAAKVSSDFKQIKCRINGPFVIGSVNKISATWVAGASTPNNTDVDVSFTLSGVMAADATYPTPINPDSVTSSTETVNAVSQQSSIETRKWPGSATLNRNVTTGVPESATLSWGVTFGLVNPNALTVKGASSASLGDISLNDDLSAMGAPWQNATLTGCGIGVAGDPYPVPIGVSSTPNPSGNRSAVKNAGTFSCQQSGGAGSDISLSNTGVDFAATWFPFGYVNSTPAQYFGMTSRIYPNEVWDSPIGTNNHAVVSGGWVTMTIPWADLVAYDGTSADPLTPLGQIRVCNTVSGLSVVGSDPSFSDPTSDNSACIDISTGTGQSVGKQFSMGNLDDSRVNEYVNSTPQNFASVSPSADNVVVPGEKLFSRLAFQNLSTSPDPIIAPQMCDIIDNSSMRIVANDFYSSLGTYNTFISNGNTIHPYYASKMTNVTTVTGFPAGSTASESDIIVEFAAVSPMTTSSALRTFDCDSVSTWYSDPNSVPGGINAANVTRVRLADGKNLIPGKRIDVSIPMQVNPSKQAGQIVQNVMRSRSGTSTLQQSSNTWTNLTSSCEVYNWAATNTATNNCDRAIVIPAMGHLELTDNTDTSLSGIVHRSPETMKSVQAGSDWTFDVRASMSYVADLSISGATAYVVLPEGVHYSSSTLAPDNIIGDCDASVNFACIANSGSRTNYGSSTLIWNLGDFQFDFPDGNDPGVSYNEEGFFGYWKVTANTDVAFASGTKRQTRAWLTANSGLASQSVSWPTVESTWGTYFDNDGNGRYDDDWISFTQTAQFIISKWTPDFLIPLNGNGRYDVTYTNASSTARTFDFIDVLPYNGDGRVPNTNYTGNIFLQGIDTSRATGITNTYITSTTSSSVNSDPASNVSVGTGMWSCTLAQMNTPGCPTASQVTALRFVTGSLAASARQTVRITIGTQNNTGLDIYTNRAMGRASGLSGEIHTEDVFFRTQYLQVGNRVFIDNNDNGHFDINDTPMPNVTMQLRSAIDDSVIDTTTTDTDGKYILHTSVEGNYYVRIAPSEMQSGGALKGYRAQDNGVVNVDSDIDEASDHNARTYSSTNIRSSVFALSNLGEPTGESGDSGMWDNSSNLTVDFALELPALIGNYAWIDLNDDGIQDSGEPGIGGVDISATWYGADNALGGGDDEIFTTTTDINGMWQIDGPAGTYSVSYITPGGYRAAKSNQGSDDSADSDSDGVVNSVAVNASNLDFDFGFVGDSTIGDTVYYDVNGDGDQDAGDIGFANVSVTISWFGIDGVFGGGDDMVITVTTDNDGHYLATGLPNGIFRVVVEVNDLPSNVRTQTQDPDSVRDASSQATFTAFFTEDLSHDFGFTLDEEPPTTTTTTTTAPIIPQSSTSSTTSTLPSSSSPISTSSVPTNAVLGGELARTGQDSDYLANLALATLLAGICIFFITKKRRDINDING